MARSPEVPNTVRQGVSAAWSHQLLALRAFLGQTPGIEPGPQLHTIGPVRPVTAWEPATVHNEQSTAKGGEGH